jgi:Ice-binding-like
MIRPDADDQEAKPMVTTITGTIRRTTSSFRLAAVAVLAVATAVLLGVAGPAGAVTAATAATAATSAPVPLGTAANFAVLAAATVTSTGPTTVTGDLGLSPGTSVTGLSLGQVTGTAYTADAAALQAQNDLATAYNDAAAQPATATIPTELGGTTVTPGVYNSAAGTFGITGTVTLDAQGDPAAVFIFQAASTLITASASNVKLINGATAANVFWVVGSSATLGTYSTFTGNIMALASITVTTGVTIDGRALARTAAVTLDTDTITMSPPASLPGCPQ